MFVRFRAAIIGSLILLVLSACTSAPVSQAPVSTPSKPIPTPEPGKAVVVGQVVSNGTQAPIRRTYVYLAQVYWDAEHKQAAYALDIARSPGTISDEQGFFTFRDVPPAEYVIVVGDFYGRNDVERVKDGSAKIQKTDANKVLDVGKVQVRPEVELRLPG